MKRTLITSALPYANGFVHLGHCAGAYLNADIFARFNRLMGEPTLYICGSDEYGVAITIAADKEGCTPQDIVDKYHYDNKNSFDKLGISFDYYSRTTNPEHVATAQEFFLDFLNKGYIIDKDEEQFYDETANMFLPDRYVEGECPNCGADKARGDQCDSCGAYYNQLELKNPVSLVSGKTPIVKKTKHWYLKFDLFQSFLEEFIESHAGDWKDNVLQQSRSWLKQGLTERAITRDLTWGVPVPLEGAEGKALYVWFEAVLGYISITKQFFKELAESNKKITEDEWKKWWKKESTEYYAFIGKDNIVFHTLIFPAMLKAREDGYIFPKNVPANEFLNLEGQKLSKSRNWTIELREFIKDFPEPMRIDALRYALASNFPETKDADFTWKDYQTRNNSELASIFGNFVNRSLQFLAKNFDSKTPNLADKYKSIPKAWIGAYQQYLNANGAEDAHIYEALSQYNGAFNDNDKAMIFALLNGMKKAFAAYKKCALREALLETMNIARAANKYFNDEAPWKSIKEDKDLAAKTLYICVQIVRSLSILFAPFLPNTAKHLQISLGLEPNIGEPTFGRGSDAAFFNAGLPQIKEGSPIADPGILFTRIEDETIAEQTAKLGTPAAKDDTKKEKKDKKAKEEKKEEVALIEFDDFSKVKLRTGKIYEAERVKKSDKLLKLQVDFGDEKRQIVAGIGKHYEPEALIGKVFVFVVNLKPAKLMGVESNGMCLAASDNDGHLALLSPISEDIKEGSEVR